MSETITSYQVNLRARYFYGACLFLFTISLASGTLFSQLGQPVLIFPQVDMVYWLFHWLGIPHWVTHSSVLASMFDIGLFFIAIIASIRPERRILAVVYTLLVLVYQITYSTYSMHHYHGMVGILFLSIAFWFKPGPRFVLVWQALRYYFFFVFSSAAIWKLCAGGLGEAHQMQHILMSQHAQYIYDSPTALLSQIAEYLISHPGLSQALLEASFLLQLSFIGGFFTRKYDRIYLVLFVSFFVFNYLVMHIFSIDLLIFCLLLVDWDAIEKKELRAKYNSSTSES